MAIKNSIIFSDYNRRLLFLFILLPFITACNQSDERALNNEKSNLVLVNSEYNECLKNAKQQYDADWLLACENNILLGKQKLASCEKIYFPWQKQNISRDQYCRNTTVESIKPSENYRTCMEILDPDIGFLVNQCVGENIFDDVQDCKLASIVIENLKEDKQLSIDECNNIHNK